MARLFYHTMQDNAGNLLFDVSGTMRLAGTGTLATIYGDENLTIILANPMTNHVNFGSFKCYLAPGDYDFYMAKAGYTFETLTGVQGSGTMANQDANAVAITGGTVAGLTSLQVNGIAGIGTAPVAGTSLTIADDLFVQGLTSLSGTLAVTGNAQVSGQLGVGTVPTGTNSLTLAADCYVGGVTNMAGNLLVGGNTQMTGQLGVGTVPTGTNSLTLAADLYAGGFTNLAGNLAVAGNTQMTGQLGIGTAPTGTNSLTLAADLYAGGYSNMNANARVGGNLALIGSLAASSSASFTGPVGVQTAAQTTSGLVVQHGKSTQYGLTIQPTGTDTGQAEIAFVNVAGTGVGFITTNATTTTYATSSDTRLKHDVTPLTGALDVIRALNPITGRWIADDSPLYGFLASEVQQVLPDAGIITGMPDAVDNEGRIQPQMIDHSKLVPFLVSALKELLARVEVLEQALA